MLCPTSRSLPMDVGWPPVIGRTRFCYGVFLIYVRSVLSCAAMSGISLRHRDISLRPSRRSTGSARVCAGRVGNPASFLFLAKQSLPALSLVPRLLMVLFRDALQT